MDKQAHTNNQLIEYIRFCLNKLDLLVDISYDNLVAISQLARSPSGRKFISKSLTVTREFDSLLFRRNTITAKGTSYTASSDTSGRNGSAVSYGGAVALADVVIKSISRDDYDYKRYPAIFDGDKVPTNYEIRYRREGDIFIPFGGKTKKLKKYLIEKKVPLSLRDHLPLVTFGNEVYVIMDTEISERLRIDNNTTKLSILGRADEWKD